MVREITRYVCGFCDAEFLEESDAESCEKDCFDDNRGDELRDQIRDDELCDIANGDA